jgi:hypothetical protein
LNNPGVDLEIPLLYNIQNEMQSFYFEVGGMFLLTTGHRWDPQCAWAVPLECCIMQPSACMWLL